MSSTHPHTLRIAGTISARPREREIVQDGDESNKLKGLSFELTSARETRQDRNGRDYNVDPKWTLSVFDFEDEVAQNLFRRVSDLQIGDGVVVDVAVIPTMRRGYPSINLRVLTLENGGPTTS